MDDNDTYIGPNYIFKTGKDNKVGSIRCIGENFEKMMIEHKGVISYNKINLFTAQLPCDEKILVRYKTFKNIDKLYLECKKYPKKYSCDHQYCKVGFNPAFVWTECIPHCCKNCKLVDKDDKVILGGISAYSNHDIPFTKIYPF